MSFMGRERVNILKDKIKSFPAKKLGLRTCYYALDRTRSIERI